MRREKRGSLHRSIDLRMHLRKYILVTTSPMLFDVDSFLFDFVQNCAYSDTISC